MDELQPRDEETILQDLAIGMPSNRANALAEFYLLEGYVPCYDFLPKMPLTMKWDLFKTSL